ncbi:MAG: AtpZ/AtpI family protein [Acidobacteria bacterium]|nr:AtpZ/AtpI family protein [Acidobacteriota bacterium]
MSDPVPGPSPHEQPESPDGSRLPGLAAFAAMGSTIAACVAVGVGLGIWADDTWHTAPAGLLIGIVLGTVAAVVSVVQQVRRYL